VIALTITIDFDLTEVREDVFSKPRNRSEYEILFFMIRWNYICKQIDCKVCLTKKGLHLYVLDKRENLNDIPIRAFLGDDPIRLEIDIKRKMRKLDILTNTLFKEKFEGKEHYKEMCLSFEEFYNEFIKKI